MTYPLSPAERREIHDRHALEQSVAFGESSVAGSDAGWTWAKQAAYFDLIAFHRSPGGLPSDHHDHWAAYQDRWGDRADYCGYAAGFANGVDYLMAAIEDQGHTHPKK